MVEERPEGAKSEVRDGRWRAGPRCKALFGVEPWLGGAVGKGRSGKKIYLARYLVGRLDLTLLEVRQWRCALPRALQAPDARLLQKVWLLAASALWGGRAVPQYLGRLRYTGKMARYLACLATRVPLGRWLHRSTAAF